MEIERKFLIKELPADLERYEHREIIQGYLTTDPVLRIRKQGDDYIFTYKGRGLMVREEVNLPLTREAFEKLLPKTEGALIKKTRYIIPLYTVMDGGSGIGAEAEPKAATEAGTETKAMAETETEIKTGHRLVAELDIFTSPKELIMAEVEFPDEESARFFDPPSWFGEEVTNNPAYHNSNMI